MKPAFITIIHDPTTKLIGDLEKFAPKLKEVYPEVFVCVSDQTHPLLIEALNNLGFNVRVVPKKGAAHARREVLKFGLESNFEHFHYCDLDRIITWVSGYFDELKETVEFVEQFDYTILGRTKRAFETHPIEWQTTEVIVNRVFELEYGQKTDTFAGSCGISRRAGEKILAHSKATMTDTEWPIIIKRMTDYSMGYKEVEGLEYVEDLNYVVEETPESLRWEYRMRTAHEAIATAINVGK